MCELLAVAAIAPLALLVKTLFLPQRRQRPDFEKKNVTCTMVLSLVRKHEVAATDNTYIQERIVQQLHLRPHTCLLHVYTNT